MYPNLYKKLDQLVQEHNLSSLTVNVFDTILLCDYWPDELRQYDIATRWLPTFQKLISPSITAYELCDWRTSTRNTLQREQLSQRADLWFDIIISTLENKYNVKLSDEDKFELLTSMIAIETAFEMGNSKPNYPLISQLAALKQANPNLRLYFLTSSHFASEQIKSILAFHQIEIFDNGVSAADFSKGYTGSELFEQAAGQLGPNFDMSSNLHLGDNYSADYLAPLSRDSLAIHYRPIRMRGLRTLVGKTWLRALKQSTKLRELKKANETKKSYATWREYGTTLASIQQIWAWQSGALAKMYDDHKVLLIGQDAADLVKNAPSLASCENLEIAPNLNLDNVLRAFIWLLATFHTARWDAGGILRILMQKENLSRAELYQLCFTEEYKYSELAINTFSEDEFANAFFNEITNSDPEYTAPARAAYEMIARFLPEPSRLILLVQVNDDSAPELFQEFAKLHSITSEIKSFTLDQDDTVKALTVKLQPLINPRRQKQIDLGRIDAELTGSEMAPDKYLQEILLPKLTQLVKRLGTRREMPVTSEKRPRYG